MPNPATFRVRGHRDEVLGHGCLVAAQPLDQPAAGLRGVGQRLEGGEGLGRDDEQRAGRVQVAGRLGQVGRVVGDEPEVEGPVRVVPQRRVGHRRPEVGAADPDVDDRPDPFAGVPGPRAVAHSVGEVGHPVQHLVHVVVDLLSVDQQVEAGRIAQGDVQHGPVLGRVDVPAAEHRLRRSRRPRARPAPRAARSSPRSVGSSSSRGTGHRRDRSASDRGRRLRRTARADARPGGALVVGQRLPLRGLTDPHATSGMQPPTGPVRGLTRPWRVRA